MYDSVVYIDTYIYVQDDNFVHEHMASFDSVAG